MSEQLALNKMSLVVTTRCNLRCRLCDEFIPASRPFSDLGVDDAHRILDKLFEVVDQVTLLHLSGGGEPFLNPQLAGLIDVAFEYGSKFDNLMTFTNSTIVPPQKLLAVFAKHKGKLIVQASDYGVTPQKSAEIYAMIRKTGALLRINKYHGENQDFGGWVDFGSWDCRNRSEIELAGVFKNCGVTKHMRGNWRTRDGKVHWCQRSQRGMELGILPDFTDDYVDLFGEATVQQKREKFHKIMNRQYLDACNYCSGNHGTEDLAKRFKAGEQIK
jgi:hypothetical protein